MKILRGSLEQKIFFVVSSRFKTYGTHLAFPGSGLWILWTWTLAPERKKSKQLNEEVLHSRRRNLKAKYTFCIWKHSIVLILYKCRCTQYNYHLKISFEKVVGFLRYCRKSRVTISTERITRITQTQTLGHKICYIFR